VTPPRPKTAHALARWAGLLLLTAAVFIAGCTTPKIFKGTAAPKPELWSGRLALTVDSPQPQSYSANFMLQGNAQAGQLNLSSPLGSTLAVLQWQPGQALLRQGKQTRNYASLDELAAAVTGTPLPLAALFDWLHGKPQSVKGWQADLSRLSDGRLTARRLQPPPAAELRLILER
jgi:outer membrane lipoprotein LolB